MIRRLISAESCCRRKVFLPGSTPGSSSGMVSDAWSWRGRSMKRTSTKTPMERNSTRTHLASTAPPIVAAYRRTAEPWPAAGAVLCTACSASPALPMVSASATGFSQARQRRNHQS
ncbi:Os02g0768100 [Oryza sativa Japonica Group]|uniref:Os02g0768100 protein n=2 Tax=Oryza sativa subsp. japonica TaxID=39947 RepID=Q0DX88_ORYSJ|nr:hypothetical protein EE612_013888 [Oryza sativa]BAF10150.1 Os02g0768100 [Oryza sativa Japonica Group]BAS81086.1 Os02g0768100 [Oryza sativa Japonica Group]|eukprot:NP_001048236.1 Os02g0768100 [Oryza sativa Japonica Group]